jgi:hypothetical protein
MREVRHLTDLHITVIAVVVAFGEVTARVMFYRAEREKGQFLLMHVARTGFRALAPTSEPPMAAEYIVS